MKWAREKLIAQFVLCTSPSIPHTQQIQLVFKETNYFIKTSSSHLQICSKKSSPLHPSGLTLCCLFWVGLFCWLSAMKKSKLSLSISSNLLWAIKAWDLGSILPPPQSTGILQNPKHLCAKAMAGRKWSAGCSCRHKDSKWRVEWSLHLELDQEVKELKALWTV